jgi:hypothetical protein
MPCSRILADAVSTIRLCVLAFSSRDFLIDTDDINHLSRMTRII